MTQNTKYWKKLLLEFCEVANAHDASIMQGAKGEYDHGLDVLRWVLKENPNASFTLKLAALFHDIDRLVTLGKGGGFKGDRGSRAYLRHKKAHALRSAKIIIPYLKEQSLANNIIDRVVFLITHHDDSGSELEKLGDPELYALVAADTFSFFSSVAPKLFMAEGKKRTRDKIYFMVDKLSETARQKLWEYTLENETFEVLKNEVIRNYYLTNSVRERQFKYCPTCRRTLKRQLYDGEEFLGCTNCGFVYWNPPHPVTSVIAKKKGKVLLMKRSQVPLRGYWCLPGGYVRYEETPQEAANREFKEETGLDLKISQLLGVYQIDNDPRGVNIDIIWTGHITDGVLSTNQESSEIQWFSLPSLPSKIAYKHREAIIKGLRNKEN